MQCPLCKKGSLFVWEGSETHLGVDISVEGNKCRACGEIFYDDNQVRKQETDIAAGLVSRGVRTNIEFKFVRKVLGLKATEVAGALDVRPETVSRWERGEVKIPLLVAFTLGELFEHPRATRNKLEALLNHNALGAET